MIYRNSYFKKELRQAYTENRTGTNRKMAFALFQGLISFAIYFVLQTLKESVLSDVVPEIMQPSFFSTVYTYIHLAFVFNTVYFIIYYDYLFFSEIRKNSWYLLVQMGYSPASMIFSKFSALIFSVFIIYLVGFVFTVFLTIFLKYPLILSYMPSLSLSGLVDLILITILLMTFSLYVKTITNARYLAVFSAVLIIMLKAALGHYNVISNRVSMQSFRNLFDFDSSLYFPAAVAIMAACCVICVIRAGNVAKYYNLPAKYYVLPEGATVANQDPATGKLKLAESMENVRHSKIFDTVSTALLIFLICAALVFNVLIILINISAPGKEISIKGIIPYVFKSDTMEPAIMMNDLAYFKRTDSQHMFKNGDIILFEENNVTYVERIIENTESGFKVDIDNYPPMSQPGAMLKTVPNNAVRGIYVGRSRWLGALILFANTIVGRLVFLLLPAILLFYQRQISNISSRRK